MVFAWHDSESWQPLVKRTNGKRQSAQTILLHFREAYSAIELYHASRPFDVQTFYSEGLRLADHEKLTARASEIYLSGAFPEIDEALFNKAVSGLSGIDHGLSYLYLDRDGLIEHCGHYLIYGSEHICGIAAGLMRERRSDFPDYRQVLKRFGRPAIIRFSVPVGKLDDSDLDELARDALLPVT